MRVAAFPSHLDSNPYCDLLYKHLRDTGVTVTDGGPFTLGWLVKHRHLIDVLHFHWIERYYRHWRGGIFSWLGLCRFMALIVCARGLGYGLVWTMHNLSAHESADPRLDRLAARFMARRAVTAVHCEYARELLEEEVPGAPVRVIEHGTYRGWYAEAADRNTARERLGIAPDALLFLFFGMIRRYKGLETLCDVFNALENRGAVLLVAGKPYEAKEEAMVESLERRYRSGSIKFVPEFIPDDQVASYFLASDYCVFPYENVLTSGSVILSLEFGRPVIAPRIGCLAGLEEHGVGVFYDAGSRSALRAAIEEASRNERWRVLSGNAAAYAERLSWTAIAGQYRRLYEMAK